MISQPKKKNKMRDGENATKISNLGNNARHSLLNYCFINLDLSRSGLCGLGIEIIEVTFLLKAQEFSLQKTYKS